jgi:hypothetical protein
MNDRYQIIVTSGRGRRGRGRAREAEPATTAEQRRQIRAWFVGRVPAEWFETPPMVTVDDEEILVVGALRPPDLGEGADGHEVATGRAARIGGFREESREQRMRIAEEAQRAFGRQVSWGASCGALTETFTTASVPVMTRLRMAERRVLDTLIDASVARSRSEALAWCVRLVASHEDNWISELRDAFEHVEQVRARGPGTASDADDADEPGPGTPGEGG